MNSSVKDAYDRVIDSVLYQLRDIKEDDSDRIDFQDIMHEEIDDLVSSNDRSDNLKAIDDTGHENEIDDGMVDRNADITMQIAQIAYCCIEQELYNNELISKLGNELNYEVVDYEKAQELIKEIESKCNECNGFY